MVGPSVTCYFVGTRSDLCVYGLVTFISGPHVHMILGQIRLVYGMKMDGRKDRRGLSGVRKLTLKNAKNDRPRNRQTNAMKEIRIHTYGKSRFCK